MTTLLAVVRWGAAAGRCVTAGGAGLSTGTGLSVAEGQR